MARAGTGRGEKGEEEDAGAAEEAAGETGVGQGAAVGVGGRSGGAPPTEACPEAGRPEDPGPGPDPEVENTPGIQAQPEI